MTPQYTKLILEAGTMIHKTKSRIKISEILVECINSALDPDLCCLYSTNKDGSIFKLAIKKGYPSVPDIISSDSEFIQFINESRELVCLNTKKNSPFRDILLTGKMESGLAISILQKNIIQDILIVNSVRPFYFKKNELSFLENIRSLI